MDIKLELQKVFAIIDSKEEAILENNEKGLDNNKTGWYSGLGGKCQNKIDAIKKMLLKQKEMASRI